MWVRIAHQSRRSDNLYVLRQGLHGDSWMNILDNLLRVGVLAIIIILWGHISYSNLIGQHWWIENERSRLAAAEYLGSLFNNEDWLIISLLIPDVLIKLKIGGHCMNRGIRCCLLPKLRPNQSIRQSVVNLTLWKIVSKSWISAHDLAASAVSIILRKILRGIDRNTSMWDTRYIRVSWWHQVIMILWDLLLYSQGTHGRC